MMIKQLDKIKLVDATLYEYAMAHLGVDVDIHKEIQLVQYFSNEKYNTSTTKDLSLYMHKKQQVVLKDFLASKGLSILSESHTFSKQNPPYMIDCDIDKDKTTRIYQSAVVFAQNETYKICMEIQAYPNNIFVYVLHSNKTDDGFLAELDLYASANNIFQGKKISCTGKFLKLDNTTWDDVVLKDGVKETIIANIDQMFSMRSKFKEYGISVKRGVILYGDPGTGKTKICKCLAKDAGYSVLYALPSDFINTNSIKNICDMAKDLSPCLLVLEDIDWIAQDRSKSGSYVMELMNRIDGMESFGDVITLATTNCLDELENAIKNRPGRFDRLIKIDLPDEKSIKNMISRFTKDFIMSADVDIDILVKCCDSLSGAHIQDLCTTAAVNAVKAESMQGGKLLLKKCHFAQAIEEIKNKNYSSYLKMQSKGKNAGFSSQNNRFTLASYFEEDSDE